jgi:hypothetical protein
VVEPIARTLLYAPVAVPGGGRAGCKEEGGAGCKQGRVARWGMGRRGMMQLCVGRHCGGWSVGGRTSISIQDQDEPSPPSCAWLGGGVRTSKSTAPTAHTNAHPPPRLHRHVIVKQLSPCCMPRHLRPPLQRRTPTPGPHFACTACLGPGLVPPPASRPPPAGVPLYSRTLPSARAIITPLTRTA